MVGWKVKRMREKVAEEAQFDGYDYSKFRDWLDEIDLFGDWSEYELCNRPVNVQDLEEYYEESNHDD